MLYKVGHHGSHNATLREKGLELMSSGELAAMIPVNRVTAEEDGVEHAVPVPVRRLGEDRGRILDLERGIRKDKPAALSDDEWAQFVNNTDVQPGWIDYWIPFELDRESLALAFEHFGWVASCSSRATRRSETGCRAPRVISCYR